MLDYTEKIGKNTLAYLFRFSDKERKFYNIDSSSSPGPQASAAGPATAAGGPSVARNLFGRDTHESSNNQSKE